jgi:hypothetical protein
MKISIAPGSMGVAKHAIDLFGMDRVDAGSWNTPVHVADLNEEEVEFAIEYFDECIVTVVSGAGGKR